MGARGSVVSLEDDERAAPTLIRVPMSSLPIKTALGGDYTGRCYRCGSSSLWDDATAYGCNNCGMVRVFG